MRFDFGRVGTITPPASRRLTEFDTPDGVLFRVKVTAASGPRPGVILAEADKIPVRDPQTRDENRTPLLPVRPADLGQEVYRLDMTDRPLLLINRAVGDWRAAARAPAFISLVYPAALRQILNRILVVDNHRETTDDTDWRCRWLRFAVGLPGPGALPDEGDREACIEWIEDATAAFARQQRLLEHFSSYWAREVGG
jgi:hypothetical protein